MKLSVLLMSTFLFLTTPFLSAQTQPEVFDVTVYEGIYPDIFNAYGTGNTSGATNHWINVGLPAGRRASVIFDPVYYVNHNSLSLSYPDALQHFLQTGLPQGLRGSLEFDVQYYMSHNQQLLANAGVTTFTGAADHFINTGLPSLGLQGSADFSVQNYMALYPDVAVAYPGNFQNATLHWLRRGKGQGRSGTATFAVSSECTAPTVTNPRIYIGVTGPFGTDSNNTAALPLDGSTADKFDAILRTRSESGVQNLIVCLQGGTFHTLGSGDFDFYGSSQAPHHNNPTPPGPQGFSVNTNWHVHGLGINGANPTTVQLQDAVELKTAQGLADWSFPSGTGLGIVFMNHDQNVSGVEISDMIIDLNYSGVKANNGSLLDLRGIYLDTHLGNHHLHHLNVLHPSGEATQSTDPNLGGERLEDFPISINSLGNISPLQNGGNLIEYVLMSDDPQTGHCSGYPPAPATPLGRCTGISIDNAAVEVRYNVVNGIENGIGGFFMPLVWFHDNFVFNNQGNGYITDSLVNRDVLIQFNEVRNPGTNGFLVGGLQTYNDFQLQYNTVYLYRNGTSGILFNGNVTEASVINNNIIQGVTISGGSGITFAGTGNSNNQFEFNQISRGLANSHTGTDCVFNNWDQFSVPLTNFANTQSSPCSLPPDAGVIASQIDPITSGLEVYFSGFDQDIRTLVWNSSTLWSQNSTDISYPAEVPNLIAGSSITNIIDTFQNQPEVYLIGTDQNIYQLYWTSTNGWLGKNLTNITNAMPPSPTQPASSGGLTSLMDTITGRPETYYVGIDSHIHQLYLGGPANNPVWATFDVSGNTGGANAISNSSLFSLADTLVGAPEVYYVGTDQHIHQLSWNSTSGWHNYDLSSFTGAPAAATGGLTALVDTLTGALEVYYIGADQDIHQLQWSGSSGWHTFDVSGYTGAAPAAIGQGTLTSFIDTLTSSLELYYVGTDQHVHQASWNAGTGWRTADITTIAGGSTNILYGGTITGLLDSLASAVDVFYVGTDHRVHELQWKSSSGWHDTNIQPSN